MGAFHLAHHLHCQCGSMGVLFPISQRGMFPARNPWQAPSPFKPCRGEPLGQTRPVLSLDCATTKPELQTPVQKGVKGQPSLPNAEWAETPGPCPLRLGAGLASYLPRGRPSGARSPQVVKQKQRKVE